MKDILFAVNATFPIVLTVMVGYFLKKIGLVDASLASAMNKLVFKVFLPSMLFLNVYKIESFADIDFSFVWYTLGATALLFGLALFSVRLFATENPKRGALLQSVFRANYALVGIPLATSLFGESGGIMATVLSAFIVPMFNMLAVVGLSIFSSGKKPGIGRVLIDITKNPLIRAIALGFVALGIRAVFVKFNINFRLTDIQPVYKTLSNLSSIATPLALIALGAQFELSAIPELKKYILFGVAVRNILIPVLGIGAAYFIGGFEGAHFATFVAVFCTPVAVSSVPMAQEMDADVALAGQLVVWTTVFSAISIFLASYVLRVLAIF